MMKTFSEIKGKERFFCLFVSKKKIFSLCHKVLVIPFLNKTHNKLCNIQISPQSDQCYLFNPVAY